METIDTIRKLLRLATNNPNETEARAAALKAAQLIIDNDVPLGQTEIRIGKTTLTPEEHQEFTDTLSALMRMDNPDEFKPAVVYPTTEIDDEFMRKRIIEAWREIRTQRQRLASEIRRYEQQSGRRFE